MSIGHATWERSSLAPFWADQVDEILAADQAVALAYATPASGVVLNPLTNTGVRDRDRGSITAVTSSVGMWKKLVRIQAEPRIAIAYHTRAHGFSERPEYVLVQGRASLSPIEDRGWIDRHRANWERFSGPREVGLWEPILRAYHWRIAVKMESERVLVWPDLACRGPAEIYGPPQAEPSAPQRKPRNGTGPRVNHRRAARRAANLDNTLLGWVGGDGFPIVVPVGINCATEHGIILRSPEGVSLPSGGRRAGLLAHSFSRYTFGQHQRKHTGWLEVEPPRAVYAPHTESGYHLPSSRFLYRIAAAVATNRGLRAARRAGFVTDQ